MKKRLIILIIILLSILIPINIFASDNLKIPSWTIDSTLLENGNLSIVEDIIFNFEGTFNGAYRNIILDSTDGIENLNISEIVSGREIEYILDPKAKKGNTNVYNMELNNNSANIMIFSPSKNEDKTFRFRYTISNVATRHKDIGEFYYKFLGEQNKTPIDYFSATINLPRFEKDKIKIFAHGPSNGKIEFLGDNLIKLNITNVSPNKFIEARILFPLDYIPNSTNIGSNTMNNIIDEEISYNEQVLEDAVRKEKLRNTLNNISIWVIALSVFIIGFIFNKFRRDPSIYENMDSIYPRDITPAELSLFMNQVVNSRAILATLFDLSRRGYITIDEAELKTSDGKRSSPEREFVFFKTGKDTDGLLNHESFLMNWLFNDIGDNIKVSTWDINMERKRSNMEFNKSQSTWVKEVQKQLALRNYYDPIGKKFGIFLMIFDLPIFILGILAIANNAMYGISLIILSIILFTYGVFLFARKSNEGQIQYDLWKDFKKNFIDFEQNHIYIPKDLTLIYAITLGLPMEELSDYRQSIGLNYYPMYWGYWYFLTNKRGGSLFEDRLTHSFYGYASGTSTSNSTSFGGGGGFSGGGGGGAGGGGAGGF